MSNTNFYDDWIGKEVIINDKNEKAKILSVDADNEHITLDVDHKNVDMNLVIQQLQNMSVKSLQNEVDKTLKNLFSKFK